MQTQNNEPRFTKPLWKIAAIVAGLSIWYLIYLILF